MRSALADESVGSLSKDKFNLESYKNGGPGKPLLRSLKQMQMAHINETQRYTIYRMRKDKKTQREIARAIGGP